MTQIAPSPCQSCVHRLTETSCEAFEVIPDSIVVWGDPHNDVIEGQSNSITWDFAPGAQQEFDLWKSVIEMPV